LSSESYLMPYKSISFHRKYYSYTGGHQKVRDYIDHFVSMGISTQLYVEGQANTRRSLFADIEKVEYQNHYQPNNADIAFLAGMDWHAYINSGAEHSLIFNLIQHVRHGDRNEALFDFLAQPAVRLCVSTSVKNAIEPYANGPCHVIRMGVSLPRLNEQKARCLYIVGNKQPELGQKIYAWSQQMGITAKLEDQKVERLDVLRNMSSSQVTLALPNKSEGFYLPGVEAMYYSDTAIVPYCVANKEYFSSKANIRIPDYSEEAIKNEILSAIRITPLTNFARKWHGKRIARQYSLTVERKQLTDIYNKYASR